MLTLFIISMIIFFGYNIAIISKFGVPESLSNSFYILDDVKKGLGYLFTIALYLTVFTLLPVWFSIGGNENIEFLKFFSAAMLGFVGAAPLFKGSDKEYHGKFAIISAITGILWIIFATPYWYLLLAIAMLMIGLMLITKTKKSITYWLEMVMFIAIYLVIGIHFYIEKII